MNPHKLDILRTLVTLPVEAAAMPAQHQHGCSRFGNKPIERARVARDYGEAAALEWDNIRAATSNYYREAQRYMDEIEADLREGSE